MKSSVLDLKAVQPTSWIDVEHHYINLLNYNRELHPMLQLVKHIQVTKASERLFCCTSIDKLVVGIYNPMVWNKEVLHIRFDGQVQVWLFKYYSAPEKPGDFERLYAVEKGIEAFDDFLKLINW